MVKMIYEEKQSTKERRKEVFKQVCKSLLAGVVAAGLFCIVSRITIFSEQWSSIIPVVIFLSIFFGAMAGLEYFILLSTISPKDKKKLFSMFQEESAGCTDIRIEQMPKSNYLHFVHPAYTVTQKLPSGFSCDFLTNGENIIINLDEMRIYSV